MVPSRDEAFWLYEIKTDWPCNFSCRERSAPVTHLVIGFLEQLLRRSMQKINKETVLVSGPESTERTRTDGTQETGRGPRCWIKTALTPHSCQGRYCGETDRLRLRSDFFLEPPQNFTWRKVLLIPKKVLVVVVRKSDPEGHRFEPRFQVPQFSPSVQTPRI